MRVRARHHRQVYSRHINEEGHGDEEDGYPETPITMRAFPVRTMVMVSVVLVRPLLVMRVRALTHWFPAFPIQSSIEFSAHISHRNWQRLIHWNRLRAIAACKFAFFFLDGAFLPQAHGQRCQPS